MKFVDSNSLPLRSPNIPDAPRGYPLFSTDTGAAVGMVRLLVGPGLEMPPHVHGGSDVILYGVKGAVEIATESEKFTVGAGQAVLIHADESAALANRGSEDAELIVAAGPANFADRVSHWPVLGEGSKHSG